MRPTTRSARLALGLTLAGLTAPATSQDGPVAPRIDIDVIDAQQLRVELVEPMQTWSGADHAIGARVAPDNPARCSWQSDRELLCALRRALTPATAFQLEIDAGLRTQTGDSLPALRLPFETERPRLTAAMWPWLTEGQPMRIEANLPLEPAVLHAALDFRLDGEPMLPAPTLQALPAKRGVPGPREFRLLLPPVPGNDRVFSVHVAPGLQSLAGPLASRYGYELIRAEIQPAFRIRELRCQRGGREQVVAATAGEIAATCAPDASIALAFSALPDADSRQRIDALLARAWRRRGMPSPSQQALGWSTDWQQRGGVHRQRGQLLQLPPMAANAALTLNFDDSLRATSGASLLPTRLRLRSEDALPQLRATHRQTLLRATARPSDGPQAINTGTTRLQLEALGRDWQQMQVSVEVARAGGKPTPLQARLAERTLADGGWVAWRPAAAADSEAARVELAAPAFDLHAWAGRREVLVWANAWEGDAAVAGAEVELLRRDPDVSGVQVVSRGRTAADGSLRLALPDALQLTLPSGFPARHDWRGPQWLLRARDAGRGRPSLAVLPLGRSSSWFALGQAPDRRVWGVSDRPLYRAGETVRYRLWQREQRGGDWVAPAPPGAVTLSLGRADGEHSLLDWSAGFDAEGSLSGELLLPAHLLDGTHCIGIRGDYEVDGSCFYVGNFRAQDLWAEVRSEARVLRDGDIQQIDLAAGYFSGGPAAGIAVADLQISLVALPLTEAYPDFADYHFVDVYAEDVEEPRLAAPADEPPLRLDAQGQLRVQRVLQPGGENAREWERRPAFAALVVEAQVRPEGRDGSVASTETTRYARHARYVGLRTEPAWFDAQQPVSLQAVVLDANGVAQPAEVEVTVDFFPGFGSDDDVAPIPLARCRLQADAATTTPCEFARSRSGRYRLTARSGDAAPARIERYLWVGDEERGGDTTVEPQLALETDSPQRDRPLRLRLDQPHGRARALLILSSGDQILAHHLHQLDSPSQTIELPVQPEWTGALDVQVLVRAGITTSPRGRRRATADSSALSLTVAPAQIAASSPIEVRFAPASGRPGEPAQLHLHNRSLRAQDLSIAVMDDALRAQAQTWLPYADPQGPGWLGGPLVHSRGVLHDVSFAGWNGPAWRWLQPGSGDPDDAVAPALGEPAPALVYSDGDDSQHLDRIEVTGSRIRRADIVEASELGRPDPSLRRAPRSGQAGTTGPAPARVRTDFADTAYWLPQRRLAPGESVEISIALPDNLTRWRAVVWSSGGGRDFAMSEASIEVGLPLEVRVQAPTRVYPGDSTWIATSVRRDGSAAGPVQARLQAEGAGLQQDARQTLSLAAGAQAAAMTRLQPRLPGSVQLIGSAHAAGAQDALRTFMQVASPQIDGRRMQAGWLPADPLSLALPALPAGASAPTLTVSLQRGGDALLQQWTEALQHYPHRCWEQILSRAVAAALARQRGASGWDDAGATIDEALRNVGVFQDGSGAFHYFAEHGAATRGIADTLPLTAYSLRALELLQQLGAAVPEAPLQRARGFLATAQGLRPAPAGRDDSARLGLLALAAAAGVVEPGTLEQLVQQHPGLSAPAQLAVAEAALRHRHPKAAQVLQQTLALAPERAGVRRIQLAHVDGRWMSSDLQLQCSLIDLVRSHPAQASETLLQPLLAGISDLYAGGAPSIDTFAGATCLRALQPRAASPGAASVRLGLGAQQARLTLQEGQSRSDWQAPRIEGETLQLAREDNAALPMSYVATLAWREDARNAVASALGFALTRRYAVLTDRGWRGVTASNLHEGDWVRISLHIHNGAERHFVALEDVTPGGLLPTDLALSAIAGRELRDLDSNGSPYFATRRLEPRTPRFYAERLPPGEHVVRYFARASNAGDYLAAPASLALMYGDTSAARTAASRLHIGRVAAAGHDAAPP